MRFLIMVYKFGRNIPKEYSDGELVVLKFPMLNELPGVAHLFTTKEGGISKGDYASMNLSFTRGDEKENVLKNYRIIASYMGVKVEDMVCSHQTHTTNVRYVTKKDCGKGILLPRDYENVDGLITNEKNVVLCTLYADCVPLYFVDLKHHAIGLSHSGWRGTKDQMGKKTLDRMKEEFGTEPKDVYAAIGPSVCGDCYEVSKEVIAEFSGQFDQKEMELISFQKDNGKYQLDLWKANEIILLNAGILKEHLSVTGICTHCNFEQMFSHRKMGDKRGNMGAFLCLTE